NEDPRHRETGRASQGTDPPDHLINRPTEDVANRRPETGPQDDPREVIQDEPKAWDAEDSSQRGHDGREPRQELRHEQRPDTVAEEEVLSPAYAHIRLQRQSAQPREHARPAPAPELVPDEVDRQRRHRDRANH